MSEVVEQHTDTPLLDELFSALANERRRSVLSCLSESDVPLALADLAKEVAASEQETSVPDVPADEAKRVYTALYHVHVPCLVEAELVTHDQDQDLVARTEVSDDVASLIEQAISIQ